MAVDCRFTFCYKFPGKRSMERCIKIGLNYGDVNNPRTCICRYHKLIFCQISDYLPNHWMYMTSYDRSSAVILGCYISMSRQRFGVLIQSTKPETIEILASHKSQYVDTWKISSHKLGLNPAWNVVGPETWDSHNLGLNRRFDICRSHNLWFGGIIRAYIVWGTIYRITVERQTGNLSAKM